MLWSLGKNEPTRASNAGREVIGKPELDEGLGTRVIDTRLSQLIGPTHNYISTAR